MFSRLSLRLALKLLAFLPLLSPLNPSPAKADLTTGLCSIGGGTSDPAVTFYSSAEVKNNIASSRAIVDTLDDAWRTATGGGSSATVKPWFGTASSQGNVSNFTYLDPAASASVNATVELVEVPISGSANCAGVSNSSSSTPFLATSAALQDSSPRPSSLYKSSNQPAFWNQTLESGNNGRRFAIRFSFDKPVKSFGAWFGDLETRTTNGTPAILRLLDVSGNRIGNDIFIQPKDLYDGTASDPKPVDQSQCGSSAANVGCGNSSTRWVGFIDNHFTPRVKQILVIVGDDDFNDDGDTEIISFIGVNVVSNNPNLLLVKRITAVNGLTTTNAGDNLAIYINEASNPYDDNIIEPALAPKSPQYPTPDTDKWPTPNTFLIGGINGGKVRPGDEIEYTIYVLSTGSSNAANVRFCDRIPDNITFIPTAFNGSGSPAADPASLPGVDRGIILNRGGKSASLTNVADGDIAEFFAAGSNPGMECGGINTNGAIVVNLGNLPNATASGVPTGSYGFIRFRGRAK